MAVDAEDGHSIAWGPVELPRDPEAIAADGEHVLIGMGGRDVAVRSVADGPGRRGVR